MRFAIKVVGSSGQGINSIGEILGKGLKRAGYCVFGYREYPSVIKGGHASYQLDVSSQPVQSSTTRVDVLLTLNHHGLAKNLPDLHESGVVIHFVPTWSFSETEASLIRERNLSVLCVPVEETLRRLVARPVLGNVLLTAFLWTLLKQSEKGLQELVTEQFGHKKDLLALNMRCIAEGCALARREVEKGARLNLPTPDPRWKEHLFLSGSEAMGLGAVAAGVRVYSGYPMSPSHPILSFIARTQNDTGIAVKQAEDEITAAQMISGAMFAGARAFTATSGGGFDLMAETVSMNGILENPAVFVLAQRPGPATGLPTWTSQGDLLLATSCAHGEFPRCVLAASDAEDSFTLMPSAFDIAEEYQIPVIVLTEKQITEGLFTQAPYRVEDVPFSRGRLVRDPTALAQLTAADRYDPRARDGVSPRWLPGDRAATYCAQADEHGPEGIVDESAENARAQMEKRMRKMESLAAALPEPELYAVIDHQSSIVSTHCERNVDVLFIGWGSTKNTVLDVLPSLQTEDSLRQSVGYLHYTYLWPLKTERLTALAASAKHVVLVEGNYQGQLGLLIRQTCGLTIRDRVLKYDGRPFFTDELAQHLRRFF